jgi:hypothetical protein
MQATECARQIKEATVIFIFPEKVFFRGRLNASEALQLCRSGGIGSLLDSPNGVGESDQCFGESFKGKRSILAFRAQAPFTDFFQRDNTISDNGWKIYHVKT